MAYNYITFPEKDLGAGIDQQSAENNIPPGYCELIQNADPSPTGQIATRKGYQGYAGYVPVRVTRIEYSDAGSDNICLYLDSSIDLSSIKSNPIIVYGKTSSANSNNVGDFPTNTDAVKYYSAFSVQLKKTFLTGTNTLTVAQTDHGFTSALLWVGCSESTSLSDNDNRVFTPDSIEINKSTYNIDVGYTNGTGSTFDGFVYVASREAVAGSVYTDTAVTVLTGTNNYTVTAATHNLNNNNIIARIYEDTGTVYRLIQPDDITIDTSGNVTITITNGTGSSFTGVITLAAAPVANVATGSVAAGATASVSLTGLTSDFIFTGIYLEQTLGGTLEWVEPNSITVDVSAGTASVEFINSTSSGKNFEIYWQSASIQSNKLCVTGSTIGGGDVFDDTRPQLTLWGLPHSEIYGSAREGREGWVTHLDSYRSVGENRLVCGLGGNLFAARLRSETGNATAYLMPELYPDLRGRVAADTVLGPVFWDTTDSPSRTRGYIQASTGGTNFLSVESASYDSGNGWVKYVLTAPSVSINGTLSTIISTTSGLEDQLLVQQMGYSVLNGQFKIKQVTVGSDIVNIWVENSSVDSSDYDETDAGGTSGIFTDRVTLNSTSPFLAGDTVTTELFSDRDVLASSGTIVLLDDVTEEEDLPGGLRLAGSRTSYVIPIRTLSETPSVTNLVRGDMLAYTGIDRLLRIVSIRATSNISLSIAGNGTTATATLGSGDTSDISVGDKVLVRGSTSFNGEQTVTAIPSLTTFQFSSTASTTEAATLVGNTISIDESLSFSDTINHTNTLTVSARWIPIEAPEDSFDLTPTTYIRYFDSSAYGDQTILRSTMVQDNLYFTNGDDEVMKFDGTNIYRAGLFRWQPHLFVNIDPGATAKIVLDNPQINYTASSGNRFTVADADRLTFQVGDEIEDSIDNERYTVVDTLDDSTNSYIIVDRTIESTFAGTPTLTKISSYRYYFRLNAVDANSNIVASAVTGADDFVVKIGADASVSIRLVGMPAWDVYDYDRIEVQIYRTKANVTTPFYRLTTLALSFNNGEGYLDYTDTASDEDLLDLDEVSTALVGAELGTGFREPLRAKYCTSADNRLILSNISDYPALNLRLIRTGDPITISTLVAAGNSKYTFRKDNTAAGTVTDMINTAVYEFVDTATNVTITPATDLTNNAGASFTVASTAHGLSAGDWVYLFHTTSTATGKSLEYAGWWQINSANVNDFTILHSHATGYTPSADDVDSYITATDSRDIPVFLGDDGNYTMANGNRTTSEPYEFLAIRRLANAINCSMRVTDISITGFETFSPWMIANAGNEFEVGQLVVRQPKVLATTFEVALPALTGAFDVFVNDIRRAASAQASAVTRVFPSRTLQSYPNYPEIFDNPTSAIDVNSLSAVDVNSADGQQITANIPFFGDAAFGAAQKSGIVVIFKENSIYLLDVNAKAAGQQAIQKLESEGKGNTAPYAVAVTRQGVMFANRSGMYRLTRALSIEYVGRKYERLWREELNPDQLALATGHHFANGNQYKLSYPIVGDSENSRVAVYNHTREYEGQGSGSWTTYTNHPATGWANLQDDSYFASVDGQVFSVRRAGDVTDYRDDATAIPVYIKLRALGFGDTGRRKIIGSIMTHYRTLTESVGTTLSAALNLKQGFDSTDSFVIEKNVSDDGLSDSVEQRVVTIQSVIDRKVGVYLQLLYQNSTIDEPIEITQVDIKVAGLDSAGIKEAVDTTS